MKSLMCEVNFLQTQIKIFVSRRLDVDSTVVSNPIYKPVICGAVYAKDEINKKYLLEDDTGENISSRRNSFCEFTVQYWAWKNEETGPGKMKKRTIMASVIIVVI